MNESNTEWGRILNIASMEVQRRVPDMLPEAAREFMWFGISDALRTKLEHKNILISMAFFRLRRRRSPRTATFNRHHREEYASSSIGDSLPLVSLRADQAAAQIIEACQLRWWFLRIVRRRDVSRIHNSKART